MFKPLRFLVSLCALYACTIASGIAQQNVPIVVAFFRPGETYTLSFDRAIDYKETWENVAKRYNLNRTELARFNRVNPSVQYIQPKSVFIPLVFNVNLFMQAIPSANTAYVPVYYIIQNKQKVANLYLRFREPMLTFIKNYNKIKDHYILNKDAPIFVGYLKINKSYGWNFKSAKDASSYKTFEQVQESMQESVNFSKLKQYSVREKQLVLDPKAISAGAVNVVGITKPSDQVTKKVVSQLSPKELRDENINFSSYMRHEQVMQERKARAAKREAALAAQREAEAAKAQEATAKTSAAAGVSKTAASTAENTKDGKAIATAHTANSEAKGFRAPEVTPVNKDRSFFESEYKEDLETGKTEQVIRAYAKQFRLLFDESSGKFYVLINGTPPGSTVKLINVRTQKTIYAKVISGTPKSIETTGTMVVISEKGAAALGVTDNAPVDVVLLK